MFSDTSTYNCTEKRHNLGMGVLLRNQNYDSVMQEWQSHEHNESIKKSAMF